MQVAILLGVYGSLLTAKLIYTEDQAGIETNEDLMQALEYAFL